MDESFNRLLARKLYISHLYMVRSHLYILGVQKSFKLFHFASLKISDLSKGIIWLCYVNWVCFEFILTTFFFSADEIILIIYIHILKLTYTPNIFHWQCISTHVTFDRGLRCIFIFIFSLNSVNTNVWN